MNWFTRSDILEIFLDAQDLLVRRYQGFYARFLDDQRVDFETFLHDERHCLCCDAVAEREVEGHRLCGRHAIRREVNLRAYREWRARRAA